MSGQDDQWKPINERGDEELALAFARLFWPEFVEREGMIFLAHQARDDQIKMWLENTNGDQVQVEAMLNHVHLYDELPHGQTEFDDDALMEVGRVMQRTWPLALAEQFPEREYWVDLVGPDRAYGPTLYLMRGSPPEPA